MKRTHFLLLARSTSVEGCCSRIESEKDRRVYLIHSLRLTLFFFLLMSVIPCFPVRVDLFQVSPLFLSVYFFFFCRKRETQRKRWSEGDARALFLSLLRALSLFSLRSFSRLGAFSANETQIEKTKLPAIIFQLHFPTTTVQPVSRSLLIFHDLLTISRTNRQESDQAQSLLPLWRRRDKKTYRLVTGTSS